MSLWNIFFGGSTADLLREQNRRHEIENRTWESSPSIPEALRRARAEGYRQGLERAARLAEEVDGSVDGVSGAGPILPVSFTELAEAIRAAK